MTERKQHTGRVMTALAILMVWSAPAWSASDSLVVAGAQTPAETDNGPLRDQLGLDILVSTDGFGLGLFYRREFTPDLAGTISLSISESKDEREVERFDYFGRSFTPGKLKRFLVLPLTFGVQYRLFREDIAETFRPYLNAGVGPSMIYVMPFVDLIESGGMVVSIREVDFFKAIGRGYPKYAASGFVGFGAHFGSETSRAVGVSFRYYFIELLSGGLPSLYDPDTGSLAGTKKSFGGFFITVNFGFGL